MLARQLAVLSLAAAAGHAAAQCAAPTLTAADRQSGDTFGRAIAFSPQAVIIGAPFDDTSNGTGTGSAYVFRRVNGAWTQETRLQGLPGVGGFQFGRAVDTDGSRFIVGDQAGPQIGSVATGRAYVFVPLIGTYGRTDLTPVGLQPGSDFGAAVAIGGTWAFVGAPRNDHNQAGVDSGAVHVFRLQNGAWSPTQVIAGLGGLSAGAGLGAAIATDGVRVVFAAPDYDPRETIQSPTVTDSGSVFIAELSGAQINSLFQVSGAALDWQPGRRFGASVDIEGDWMVIGAPDEDAGIFTDHGAVYVSRRQANGTWSEPLALPITGEPLATDARWGSRVSIHGDTMAVTGDGANKVVVFKRSGNDWRQDRVLRAVDFTGATTTWGNGLAAGDDAVFIGDSGAAPGGLNGAGQVRPVGTRRHGHDSAFHPETVAIPGAFSGCLQGATPTTGLATPCANTNNAKDVFFRFVPAAAGTLVIDTVGSPLDTVLSVYDSQVGEQTLLACDDNGAGSGDSRIILPVAAGAAYVVRVAGKNMAVGSFNLNIQPLPCRADMNADGVVDFNDLLAFLNEYNASSPEADFNNDGVIDFNDVLEFLNQYNTGC